MIRVHELAKEFKIPVKTLKKHLFNMGVVVKSHMSKIDEEIAENIRAKVIDFIRKRQRIQKEKIIRDLIMIYNYPQNRIISEPIIKIGKKTIQPDIVVYEDNELKKALLVIEIKQYLTPKIQENTKGQILQYAIKLKAKYAVILLPTSKFVYKIKENKLNEIAEIPIYDKKNIVKELTPEELQKLKLILKKQLKFLPLLALPSLAIPILPFIITPFLFAFSKNIIDIIRKDKYSIFGGGDFLEEQKEKVLKSEIKEFIIFIKNHFNLEHNKEFQKYLSDHKLNFETTNSISKIIIKITILVNILHHIEKTDIDHYKEFNKSLIDKLKELIEKDEKEKSLIRVEEQKIANIKLENMIQQYTHTLSNTLFPNTIYEVAQRLKKHTEYKKDAMILTDAYHAEIFMKHQGQLLAIRNTATAKNFQSYIRSDRLEKPTDEEFVTIYQIINTSAERVLSRFFNEDYHKLENIRKILCEKHSIELDDWKDKFEKDVFYEENNAIDWINNNFAKVEFSISEKWSKILLKKSRYAEALLQGYFGELFFNALKYRDHLSAIWVEVEFSEKDIEGEVYLTTTWKNKYKKDKNISISTNKGLISIQNDLEMLNEMKERNRTLIIKQDEKHFKVKLLFKKDLLLLPPKKKTDIKGLLNKRGGNK